MIERLNIEDIDKLQKTFPSVFLGFDIKDSLSNNPFTYFYLLKDNDKIIGFINYDIIYDRCELININVLDNYQGLGYGKKLMKFMFDNLDSEINNVTLEVKITNDVAINLYNSFGFKTVSKREKYYNGIDALLMIKELK